jgi:hypothetical protein
MQCHRRDRAASYEFPGEDESREVPTAILVKAGLPLVSIVAPRRRAVANYNKREGRASVHPTELHMHPCGSFLAGILQLADISHRFSTFLIRMKVRGGRSKIILLHSSSLLAPKESRIKHGNG